MISLFTLYAKPDEKLYYALPMKLKSITDPTRFNKHTNQQMLDVGDSAAPSVSNDGESGEAEGHCCKEEREGGGTVWMDFDNFLQCIR